MTCKKCEEQRRKLKEAWSQKDLIKAAAIAMEGALSLVVNYDSSAKDRYGEKED